MQRKNVNLKKESFSGNLKYYYLAVLVIVIGYVFLSIGDANSFTSLTLGPVILFLGYLVAIPAALLCGVSDKKEDLTEPGVKNDTKIKGD